MILLLIILAFFIISLYLSNKFDSNEEQYYNKVELKYYLDVEH